MTNCRTTPAESGVRLAQRYDSNDPRDAAQDSLRVADSSWD